MRRLSWCARKGAAAPGEESRRARLRLRRARRTPAFGQIRPSQGPRRVRGRDEERWTHRWPAGRLTAGRRLRDRRTACASRPRTQPIPPGRAVPKPRGRQGGLSRRPTGDRGASTVGASNSQAARGRPSPTTCRRPRRDRDWRSLAQPGWDALSRGKAGGSEPGPGFEAAKRVQAAPATRSAAANATSWGNGSGTAVSAVRPWARW